MTTGRIASLVAALSTRERAALWRWDCQGEMPMSLLLLEIDPPLDLLAWARALFAPGAQSLAAAMAAHDLGGMMDRRLERLLDADLSTSHGREVWCRTLRALHGRGCRRLSIRQAADLISGGDAERRAIAREYYAAVRRRRGAT